MKFNHMINYNGTYYKAGEEVPIEEEVRDTADDKGLEPTSVKDESPAPKTRRRGRPSRKE